MCGVHSAVNFKKWGDFSRMKRFPKHEKEIKKLGLAIQKIRMEKNVSVSELALESEIDRRTIQRIEKGNAVVTIHTLLSIAEALQVDLRIFFEYLDSKMVKDAKKTN